MGRNGRYSRVTVALALVAIIGLPVFARPYTVRAGDTLSGIARRELGDPALWREIAVRNSLQPPYRLEKGQALDLPSGEDNALPETIQPVEAARPVVPDTVPFNLREIASPPPEDGRGRELLVGLSAELDHRNRSIRAARQSLAAATERPSQAASLPDPVVRGRFIRDQEQRGMVDAAGMTSFNNENMNKEALEVSQMIPVGKLGPMAQVEERMIRVRQAELEMVRTTAVRRLKTALVELSYADESRRALERMRALLRSILESAEALYRVGQAAQADVLRAQLELSMVNDRLIMIDGRRAAALAELNSLLDRAAGTPCDGVPPLDAYDPADTVAGGTYPEVMAAAAEADVATARIAVARAGFTPDVEVMAGIENRPDYDPMWEVGLGVTLPLWSGTKQTPAYREAEAEFRAAEERLQAARAEAARILAQSLTMARSARAQIVLYENTILPQARMAYEAALASYRVGAVDYMVVLGNSQTLLNYELARAEATANFYRAVAMIEETTGTTGEWRFRAE